MNNGIIVPVLAVVLLVLVTAAALVMRLGRIGQWPFLAAPALARPVTP